MSRMISIPHRSYFNYRSRRLPHISLLFQSLIGLILTTPTISWISRCASFQSLIGLILTKCSEPISVPVSTFQSLIGLILTCLIGIVLFRLHIFQSLIGLILTYRYATREQHKEVISIPHRSYFNICHPNIAYFVKIISIPHRSYFNIKKK